MKMVKQCILSNIVGCPVYVGMRNNEIPSLSIGIPEYKYKDKLQKYVWHTLCAKTNVIWTGCIITTRMLVKLCRQLTNMDANNLDRVMAWCPKQVDIAI